jgi:hypothetical protein
VGAALDKLETLRQKLQAFGQERNVVLMITYLQCRRCVQEELRGGREEAVVEFVRRRLAPFLGDSYMLLAKIKAMSVLSILLLRFHGILMTADEKNILVKTIELKKKKMLLLDSKSEREQEFECLLYLLLELYKILYLLKSDQQTIQHYYSQLQAYAQLFTAKHHHPSLDLQELAKILDSMKPVLNDLNVYEDSQLRQQLASAHIKEEVLLKEEQKHYRRSIDKETLEAQRNSLNSITGSSQKVAGKGLKLGSGNRRLALRKDHQHSREAETFREDNA